MVSGVPAQAAFPGTNGAIAFVSDRDGTQQVYRMKADGSGERRLTDAAGLNTHPDWSANGKKIVFLNCPDTTGETCAGGIYRMNAAGSREVLLERNSNFYPSWFPTSNKIAFKSYGDRPEGWGIYAMTFDAKGNPTGTTLLTNNGDCPEVSPDGTKIAFLSSREEGQGGVLSVMRAAPESAANQPVSLGVSLGPCGTNDTHDWSPDGKKIAYTQSGSIEESTTDIWVMNADGTGKTNITKTPDAWEQGPAFSPDGTKIAFSGHRDGNYDIWKMGADGSDPTRLTDSPGAEYDPDWRPLP
jgi:Tol biopolymer transport system component